MHLTLTLMAGLTLPGTIPNLDLAGGKAEPWQGDGGKIVLRGTTRVFTTADDGGTTRAILHRTFTVPPGAAAIEFAAAAYRPAGAAAGGMLEVVLEAAKREAVPRQVRQGGEWVAAPTLSGPSGGQLREYRWPLDAYAGKRVRIAVVDADGRAGCHVVTTGFRLVTRDELNGRKFAEDMRKISARPLRSDSKHFMALGTASAADSEYRLANCEAIHALFFEHFRTRGFEARVPTDKLMVAILDTQERLRRLHGREAPRVRHRPVPPRDEPARRLRLRHQPRLRLGRRPRRPSRTGGSSDLERERNRLTFGRAVRDRREDTNISTMMHEVAHQLSFNCGLLNPHGDVPVWLAEGLAVYCESTVKGAWQGIGEANPSRAGVLAPASRGDTPFIPLRDLIRSDDWIRKARRTDRVVLGYSQSWALFRMLMEERPEAAPGVPPPHPRPQDAGPPPDRLRHRVRGRPGEDGETLPGVHARDRAPGEEVTAIRRGVLATPTR